MNKKKYAIIGNPLSHSLSPILHNYWFNKYNINAEYHLLEIKEKEILKIIELIKEKKIFGINVTLPYKQKVIPYVDKLVNDAKISNSVNTIYLNNENLIIGDNTDIYGLQAGYFNKIIDIKLRNSKALIIGAGGVSPSVIVALKKSNINNISLINRTNDKSFFLKKMFPDLNICKWSNLNNIVKDYDIIVNATSLGLKNGEEFDALFESFKESMIYIDTIYNPLETKMIRHLKSKKIKTYNGLDMFIYQGQKSFYLWNTVNPEIDDNLISLLASKLK